MWTDDSCINDKLVLIQTDVMGYLIKKKFVFFLLTISSWEVALFRLQTKALHVILVMHTNVKREFRYGE